jgi:hypothetical protein
VCVRAVKPLQFPRPLLRSVTRSLITESPPRSASSASDTDDEGGDKEDEDEGPRPYSIAGKPL